MKKPRLIIIVPVVISAIVAYVYTLNRTPNEELIGRVFGNRQLSDAIVASRQVTAQRLHWRDRNEISHDELSNYNRGPSVAVSASQVRRLKRLLQKSSSYQWGFQKNCLPDYGVLFTFRDRQRVIQVALCFNCNMLGVFDGGDDKAHSVNTVSGFDPMRSDLVAIVKKVFPDDPEIQELASSR